MEERLIPSVTPEEEEDKATEAPVEEADKEKEESQATEEKPQLILGKFKTQADLEKAYKELERTFGKTQTTLSQLKKELEELRKSSRSADEKRADELEDLLKQDPQQWLNALYSEGPKAVLALVEKAIERKTKPLEETLTRTHYETKVQEFRRTHPDMDEYADDMAAFFEAHPKYALDPDGLELAYKAVKYDRLTATLPAIDEEAAEEKGKVAREKAAARMPSGGGGKSAPKEESVEEQIRKSLLGGGKKQGIFG